MACIFVLAYRWLGDHFALGYRQMMPGGWNFGIWGGYDVRRSAFGNTFHQLAEPWAQHFHGCAKVTAGPAL